MASRENRRSPFDTRISACLDVEVCDVARSMADLRQNFDDFALQ